AFRVVAVRRPVTVPQELVHHRRDKVVGVAVARQVIAVQGGDAGVGGVHLGQLVGRVIAVGVGEAARFLRLLDQAGRVVTVGEEAEGVAGVVLVLYAGQAPGSVPAVGGQAGRIEAAVVGLAGQRHELAPLGPGAAVAP